MAMKTRYSFGGDEHLFAEIAEEMSLEAFFKSFAMTNAVRESRIKGVTEICPANASLQVRFDPDVISPHDMLTELKQLEAARLPKDSTPSKAAPNIHRFITSPPKCRPSL